MISFTKAQIASILATGVDFAVTFLLLRFLGGLVIGGMVAGGVISGGIGTVCGGVTHFLVSRNWVFQAQEGKWAAQLNRYVLVWTGNLLLNVSGLYLLIHFAGIKAMLAKVIVAVTVAVCYNYILQKRFVFK
ncbi:MAG TPA: GtrA family protein [Puia sp.]|jgi:putative flippase GtrA|nr:GtrA family protein [Puia sp.]